MILFYRLLKNCKPIFSALFLTAIFLSCGSNQNAIPDPEERIVASIGDEVITVREFRLNYELGFSHLKTGQDRKKTYLNYLIKEKILMQEGVRLGFDQTERVKNAEKLLMNELLIEALIEKEVKNKLKVSQEEIRQEINKSKVSFKYRFWVETNLERAQNISRAMKERGYADVVDEILRNNPERELDPRDLQTDYVNYQQVPPHFLDAIKNLPIGDISGPVELEGRYFIFQVLDIRRNAVTETEYSSKASTFEQIIFYQKLREEVVKYGTALMAPKKVVTKGEAFKLLGNAIVEWERTPKEERSSFKNALYRATEKQPHLKALKDRLNNTFSTSTDRIFTIDEFLDIFDVSAIQKNMKEHSDFYSKLNQAVGITLRNYFLAEEARKQNLQHSASVQKKLALWRKKWIYSETRFQLTKNVKLDENRIKDYFEKNKERYRIRKDDDPKLEQFFDRASIDAYQAESLSLLNRNIHSLESRFPVFINETVLDTIRVIDFQKSYWASLQLYRKGSQRPAYPVVDSRWSNSLKPALNK